MTDSLKKTLHSLKFITYEKALVLLVLIHLVFFAHIFQGKVILPNNNRFIDVGLPGYCEVYSSNGYGDTVTYFLPNIDSQLSNNSLNWIPTWIPEVEFGRPFTFSWATRGFLVTNLLAYVLPDSALFLTVFTALLFLLGAIFCFLFLKELGLHPLAVMLTALLSSFSAYHILWQTFPMFVAIRLVFFGLLWGVTTFIRKPTWMKAGFLSFLTYSALFITRKQALIFLIYILAFYTLWLIWQTYPQAKARAKMIAYVGLVVGTGAIAFLPTLLDFLELSAQSVRMQGVSQDWLTAELYFPSFDLKSYSLLAQSFFDSYWFGSIHKNAAVSGEAYRSFSLTPVVGTLLVFSLRPSILKKSAFWFFVLGISILVNFVPEIYYFGAKYLGWGFSRSTPLGWGNRAAYIILAFVLDEILRDSSYKVKLREWIVLAVIFFNGLAIFFVYQDRLAIQYVLYALLFFAGVLAFLHFRKIWILLILVIGSIYVYGHQFMFWRDSSCFPKESSLTRNIQTLTHEGGRFAWVGNPGSRFPSNQEILYGVSSIHTYNPLSSVAYQQLIHQLTGGQDISTYGRKFSVIDSLESYKEFDYQLANVALFITDQELAPEQFNLVNTMDNVRFYEPIAVPVHHLQVREFGLQGDEELLEASINHLESESINLVTNLDDFQVYKVTSLEIESLVFISQQYHHRWQATDQDGNRLATARVNGFYQGVLVPPNVSSISMRFIPWSYYAFIPQAFYLAVAGLGVFKWLVSKKSKPSTRQQEAGSVI